MSCTKVQHSNDLAAAVIYAVYGTRANARQGIIRADAVTVFNSGSSDPMEAVQEWLDELKKYPERVNEAHIVIGSFHPDELNKDKRAHVELGHYSGNELARRIETEGVFSSTQRTPTHAAGMFTITRFSRIFSLNPAQRRATLGIFMPSKRSKMKLCVS